MRLPLAKRELTRSARGTQTYFMRLVIVGLAAAAVFIMWIGSIILKDAPPPDDVGMILAAIAFIYQFAVVLLFAPLATAGLIAQEKQDRTLSLLLLADFGGSDIFFAKFVSAFFNVELLILSTLPILAFVSFMGGVSVPVMALSVLLFGVWAYPVCAIGLFWSTISKRPGTALFLTLMTLAAWCAATLLTQTATPVARWIAAHDITRIYNIITAIASIYDRPMQPLFWVPSVIVCGVIGTLVSLLTIILVPRQAYEKARVAAPGRASRSAQKFRLVQVGPLGRLIESTAKGLSSTIQKTSVRAVTMIGLFLVSLLTVIGPVFIVLMVVYDVVISAASMKRTMLLDDLRMTVMDIVDGRNLAQEIYKAHLNRTLFYFPAFICGGMLAVIVHIVFLPDLYRETLLVVDKYSLYAIFMTTLGLAVWRVCAVLAHLRLLVAISCFSSNSNHPPVRQSVFAVIRYLVIQVAVAAVAVFSGALFEWIVEPSTELGEIATLIVAAVVHITLMLTIAHSYFIEFRRRFTKTVCLFR